jgi:hypothetical protein
MNNLPRRKPFHTSDVLAKAAMLFLFGIVPLIGAIAQTANMNQAPHKAIDNGLIHAEIYLPDAANGFYRGTRFDWSGIIGELKYAGHNFYGPWFDKFDPQTHDYVVQNGDIVVGLASGSMGPTEEFNAPLGFDDASAGGTFVKIGVGVLRKPDTAKYDHYRAYDIVDGAKWNVKSGATSIEFTQRVIDKASGYGYLYTKTVRLVPGQPQMMIEHSLKNIGVHPIDTDVYDHNFLVLDKQPTGPDFTIRVPYTIQPKRPVDTAFVSIHGNTISFNKQLSGDDRLGVAIGGYSDKAKDYDFTVENTKEKASVRVTGDRPLANLSLFSTRSVVAMEPFVHLVVAKGQQISWKYVYTYSAK